MGHSCGALEEQDTQSNGRQKSFSLQRGIWTLGTGAEDHLCYILEKNLAVSHKYLEHQSEEALKDNGLICLTKILKQRSTQAMAWLLLIAFSKSIVGEAHQAVWWGKACKFKLHKAGWKHSLLNVSLLKKNKV